MKKVAGLFLAAFLVGCGGGGGGGGSHPPAISNLHVSPTSALVNSGGGTVNVTGSFDFADGGGDLAQVVLTTYDNTGAQVASMTVPAVLPGVTAATLTGVFVVDTTAAGDFTFRIVVYDSAGSASNSLGGTFSVTPDPWQARSLPLSPTTALTSVAYGGGLFLAGADDNTILGSADGATWFVANPGSGKMVRRLAYGNGRFVAIAEDAVNDFLIASADNGATWTPAQQTFTKGYCRDVSFGNGIFFMTYEYWDYLFASLDNGATWSIASSGIGGVGMDAPAYGNGKYVAAAGGGKTLVSDNGVNWSLGGTYGSYTRPSIAYDNGVFAIVPLQGNVHVSHDNAATWQMKIAIPYYWWMWDVAAGGGMYVGVGRSETLAQGVEGALCASRGGDSWVWRTLGSHPLRSVAYGNGTFVAVGDNATIYQSAPGWRP